MSKGTSRKPNPRAPGTGCCLTGELVESMEQEAQRLIAEMLKATGWTEQDLGRHRKGGQQKVRIAAK
jgi:hypothetical protein